MAMPSGQLTPLQLELLKVFAFSPTEEELLEVRKLLAEFFAHRLVDKVESAIQEKQITLDGN